MHFSSELEREIMEIAAEDHPETIPALLLVSKHVHDWIERIQYLTFCDRTARPLPSIRLLRNAIHSKSKPSSFFHDRVRNLFMSNPAGLDEILSACSAVRSLVLFSSGGPQTLPALDVMPLRRLGFHLTAVFRGMDSVDPGLFTLITHLDIFEPLEKILKDYPNFLRSTLALLPALTHLGLYKLNSPPLATELLTICTKLEVLLGIHNYVPDLNELLPVDDPRFVSIYVSDTEYCRDWIAGTRRGLDFWARAEDFIAKKRSGEIKPDARSWIVARD
ncbi:hypothetical protein B0H11DRAFT_2086239 [Mycena galericulata]|nr:hypothetical protein B0H11DRAFT_2086239 [Mycena galericulata]